MHQAEFITLFRNLNKLWISIQLKRVQIICICIRTQKLGEKIWNLASDDNQKHRPSTWLYPDTKEYPIMILGELRDGLFRWCTYHIIVIINPNPTDHPYSIWLDLFNTNWWIGDRESLQTGQPSIYNIDAIEDSEVALISKEKFDDLCIVVPAFNNMINAILQKSFLVAQNRIHTFISMSAEEKYLSFLENFPHLNMRVPQTMIASYLGITAETLSRVRKQIITR